MLGGVGTRRKRKRQETGKGDYCTKVFRENRLCGVRRVENGVLYRFYCAHWEENMRKKNQRIKATVN